MLEDAEDPNELGVLFLLKGDLEGVRDLGRGLLLDAVLGGMRHLGLVFLLDGVLDGVKAIGLLLLLAGVSGVFGRRGRPGSLMSFFFLDVILIKDGVEVATRLRFAC